MVQRVPHIALMGPEIPSVSMTFVFREGLALERAGARVTWISLRDPGPGQISKDGAALARRVHTVYRGVLEMLRDSACALVWHPVRSARTLVQAARDAFAGRARLRDRVRVPYQALAALSLGWRWRTDPPQRIHVHFAHAPATVAMYAARFTGVSFSVVSHANDIYERPVLLPEKLERAEPFLTISQQNQRYLQMLEPESRPEVSYLGVDTARFKEVEQARRPATVPTIVSVGRLVEKKGFDVLIDALAALRQDGHFPSLLLAGDGPLRQELEARVAELGMESQVHFMGEVNQSQILRLLGDAHIFALPCRIDRNGDQDGIPVVLMEAMAAGLCCVSTRLSGIPELIHHGHDGLLADPGCAQSFASELGRVLRDPKRLRRLGEHAMQTVQDCFDIDRNARRLLDRLQGIEHAREQKSAA